MLRLTLALVAIFGSLFPSAASVTHPGTLAGVSFATRAAYDPTLSTNWAGYAVTTPAMGVPGTSFTDVTGTWMQPRVRCPTGEVGAAAFWVGLGGWEQTSQALEQIGTEADCNTRGQVTYSAWYEIVPAGPVRLKLTVPKFVSGTTVQRRFEVQSEGASAIHSAEPVSSCDPALRRLLNRVCLVRFFKLSTTWPAETTTAAVTRSRGRTVSSSLTGPAGTISNHAEYVTGPRVLQSASVPICSSA